MRTRTKARLRATEALYEAEQRGVDVSEVLARNPAGNDYGRELALLVRDHQNRIDEVVATYARSWSLSRMPAVDRAIARIGVAELIMRPDVDTAIVISEAVEVAGVLSTDESAQYLNGLLGAVAAVRDRLAVPE